MKYVYNALISNNTWTLVPHTSKMYLVGYEQVFTVKYNPDGTIQRYKSRLVAKGFQRITKVDYFETFSSVVKAATITLSLTVHFGQDVQQIDINNVFLNRDLEE